MINSHELSQVVLTESAATCMLNQISKSPLGNLWFNENKFNDFFHVDGYSFNSTSLASHIKIFEDKIGKNKPMKVDINFKDIQVRFGQNEVDMTLDYTIMMKWRMDLLGAHELLYDEIVMQTSSNIRAENDILHVDILEHKINLDSKGGNRMAPKRNSMNMTVNEYQEFLEDWSFTTSEFKKWMNDVILRGDRVSFPYSLKEFQTSLNFQPNKVHVMVDIEDNAY